jgi:hypothetical protein
MLQPRLGATSALLGLLITAAATIGASTTARADDRGYYRSDPQIRLGVDLIWGGYGYAPPRPPVVYYPSRPYYEPYYEPYRSDYRGEWRGKHRGRGHRKHRHNHDRDDQRWDDCDD